eukprot:404755_1
MDAKSSRSKTLNIIQYTRKQLREDNSNIDGNSVVNHIKLTINKEILERQIHLRYNNVDSATLEFDRKFNFEQTKFKMHSTFGKKLKHLSVRYNSSSIFDISEHYHNSDITRNFQIYGSSIFDMLPPLLKLTHLKIYRCSQPWRIFKYIVNVSLLTHMELNNIELSKELIETITHCSNLKTLELHITHCKQMRIRKLSAYINNELILKNGKLFPLKQLKTFGFDCSFYIYNQSAGYMDLFAYWILANCTQKLNLYLDVGNTRIDSSWCEISVLENFFSLYYTDPSDYNLVGREFKSTMVQKSLSNIKRLYIENNLFNVFLILNNISRHIAGRFLSEDENKLYNHQLKKLTVSISIEDGEQDTKVIPSSINIYKEWDIVLLHCIKNNSAIYFEYLYNRNKLSELEVDGCNNFVYLWGCQFAKNKAITCWKKLNICIRFTGWGRVNNRGTEILITSDNMERYIDTMINYFLHSWFVNINENSCSKWGIRQIIIGISGGYLEIDQVSEEQFYAVLNRKIKEKYESVNWPWTVSFDRSEYNFSFTFTFEILKRKKECHQCYRRNSNCATLRLCSRCRKVYYCSKYCQKQSWNTKHRYQCL